MIPKGSAVHGMMPPTVAVSSRSVICMLALKATASRTDPTIDRVSVRHRLGKGIGGIGSKRPPRPGAVTAVFIRAPLRHPGGFGRWPRGGCGLSTAGQGRDGGLSEPLVH